MEIGWSSIRLIKSKQIGVTESIASLKADLAEKTMSKGNRCFPIAKDTSKEAEVALDTSVD